MQQLKLKALDKLVKLLNVFLLCQYYLYIRRNLLSCDISNPYKSNGCKKDKQSSYWQWKVLITATDTKTAKLPNNKRLAKRLSVPESRQPATGVPRKWWGW
jgi:hypothetical protein